MTIYVDDAAIMYRGKLRYHMTATLLIELHIFADSLGIRRCWYHPAKNHPHYDITKQQRDDAINNGAVEVDQRSLLQHARQIYK